MGKQTFGPTTYIGFIRNSLPVLHSCARPANATEAHDQSCTGVGSGRYRLPIVPGRDKPTIQTWTQCATPKHDTSADDSHQRGQLGHNRRNRSAPVRFRFSGGIETRKIVYICRDTSDFFLSRRACVEPGVVPPDFPDASQKQQSTAEERRARATSARSRR